MQGLAVVVVLWAQWTNPYTGNQFNNPISSTLDTIIRGKMQQQMLEKSFSAHRGEKPAAPVAHKSLAASDFRPVGKEHPTVDAYLSAPNLTPDARKTMRAIFDATFEALGKTRQNNVATALAGALAVAMGVATERPMSDAAGAELLLAVNDLLADSPDFARLKPKEKQAMYETLVMTTGLLSLLHEAGKSNLQVKNQSVALARNVLQQLTGSAGPK
jgi:hypothetical protein